MISLHHIEPEQLAELVSLNGGPRPASRLLGVTPKQLDAWQRTATIPQCGLRLLWLLSPEGMGVLNHEIGERLACLGRLNRALDDARRRTEAETAVMRSSHQAELERLKAESRLLRSLVSHPGLSKALGLLSGELHSIANTLLDLSEAAAGSKSTTSAEAMPAPF